jgi:hypothetical protein
MMTNNAFMPKFLSIPTSYQFTGFEKFSYRIPDFKRVRMIARFSRLIPLGLKDPKLLCRFLSSSWGGIEKCLLAF